MKSLPIAAVAAFSLLAAGALHATETSSAATAKHNGSAPVGEVHGRLDPNAKICQHMEETGSRLGGQKVCKTRREWADIAAANRDAVQHVQDLAVTVSSHD